MLDTCKVNPMFKAGRFDLVLRILLVAQGDQITMFIFHANDAFSLLSLNAAVRVILPERMTVAYQSIQEGLDFSAACGP